MPPRDYISLRLTLQNVIDMGFVCRIAARHAQREAAEASHRVVREASESSARHYEEMSERFEELRKQFWPEPPLK